jgi:hypothetical protein
MLYLWLAIICSASIALIFKHSESRGMNRYAVTTANYLAASVVSIVILFSSGLPLDLPGSLSERIAEIGRAVAGSGETLSPAGSIGWAMLLGLMAGAVFFSAFMYYFRSTKPFSY